MWPESNPNYSTSTSQAGAYSTPNMQAPIDRLSAAVRDSFSALERIESIADVLCGSVPRAEQGGKPHTGGGLFGDIAAVSELLAERTLRANAAMDRISAVIPPSSSPR